MGTKKHRVLLEGRPSVGGIFLPIEPCPSTTGIPCMWARAFPTDFCRGRGRSPPAVGMARPSNGAGSEVNANALQTTLGEKERGQALAGARVQELEQGGRVPRRRGPISPGGVWSP